MLCDLHFEKKMQKDNEIGNNGCGEVEGCVCGTVTLESISYFKRAGETHRIVCRGLVFPKEGSTGGQI